MKKNLVYILLSLIMFSSCLFKVDDCHSLPNSELLLIHQGDTLIYTNSANKKDTFRVTSLNYSYYTTGLSKTCYQILHFVIEKVNNSIPDTAGFYQMKVDVSEETGLNLWFQRTSGIEAPLYDRNLDFIYNRISIGGTLYNSVYYYSGLMSSKNHCRDLYYSYQYGILSIKINNNFIYLSEIKPAR